MSEQQQSLRKANHFHLNKVLGFHNFLQILLHSNKRWIKNSWGREVYFGKSKVKVINGKLERQKARRRRILLHCLIPNLTVIERISLQESLEDCNWKIHALKNLREKSRLPRMRGDREQGVIRI